MFKLLKTLKPLGIRDNTLRPDIEFPTRNQLKCFLAKQISKERKQLRQGFLDKDGGEHQLSIISSTDFLPDTAVTSNCKTINATSFHRKKVSEVPMPTVKLLERRNSR